MSRRPPVIPDTPIHAAELHIGSGVLFDIVVIATGSDAKMSPLCDDVPRAMLSIGGKPLIWHCLRHWVDNGVRQVFLCLHEYDRTAIQIAVQELFPKVTFHMVDVKPNLESGSATTSCHALAAYRDFKRSELRGTPAGYLRDALVVNCDTILTKVDLQPFLMNFYANVATVGVLLWRVAPRLEVAAAAAPSSKGAGGGKKGGAHEHLEYKKYQEDFVSVIAEPDDETSVLSSLASSKQPNMMSSPPVLEHFRLHFLEHGLDEANVSIGFAARRPNLVCFADASDAGVYLLRPAALDYICRESKEDPSLQLDTDLIPTLARSQHTTINSAKQAFKTPGDKLELKDLSVHWALQSTGQLSSLSMLNSVQPFASSAAVNDTLKVVCTVLNERAEMPTNILRQTFPPSIRRVTSADAYVAVSQEYLATFNLAQSRLHELNHSGTPAAQREGPPPSLSDCVCFASTPSFFPYSSTGAATLDELVAEHSAAQPSRRVVESLVLSPSHDSSYITRSIIGRGVTFGKDCRVTNSIIMDHVELGDKTIISNAVIGGGAEIRPNQTVSKTMIAPRTIVGGEDE